MQQSENEYHTFFFYGQIYNNQVLAEANRDQQDKNYIAKGVIYSKTLKRNIHSTS